jgi:hypothetical protein
MEDKHVRRVEDDVQIGLLPTLPEPSGEGGEGDIASSEHEGLLSQEGRKNSAPPNMHC